MGQCASVAVLACLICLKDAFVLVGGWCITCSVRFWNWLTDACVSVGRWCIRCIIRFWNWLTDTCVSVGRWCIRCIVRFRNWLTSGFFFPRDFLIKRYEQDNPGVRNVENEIIKRMKLREKTWTQDLDDGRIPVLAFCVNASRIGTDIESALRGVNDHRPVMMVVLHCKKPSSLCGDLSDDDYLLDQALRDRVTGIAHFAFSGFDGFYSCRQNDDGYGILSDLLSVHHDFLIKRCEQDNPGVRNVEDEIIRRMKLHEKTWTPDLDDGQTPVLVFCVNASRIGTDIESALEGVNDHRPVLAVLHCKKPSSLCGDLSDDDYLLDQALLGRVTGIAHLAFSESDGFYSCHQNDGDGFRKLSDLLSKVTENAFVLVGGWCITCMRRRIGRFWNWLTSGSFVHHDFLIKRCEQNNPGVRDVEDKIIRRMNLREKTWTQDLDDGRTPVLVFCVNASRIGTDIESALRGVRNHRPVLVVLHCKNKSSLRGDLSDDDYLLDQALRDRVTGIVHFVFSEFDGFYACRQNNDGYGILSDLIE